MQIFEVINIFLNELNPIRQLEQMMDLFCVYPTNNHIYFLNHEKHDLVFINFPLETIC